MFSSFFGFKDNEIYLNKILSELDYSNILVGGSYALKKYLNSTWDHNDIDIFMLNSDVEDFDMKTNNIISNINYKYNFKLKLIKERLNDGTEKIDDEFNEKFHESILKTRTYSTEYYSKPIQFISIDKNHFRVKDKNLETFLSEIVDIPSVFFKLNNNKKEFIVPEKCVEILKSGKGSKSGICGKRLQKYTQRGFEFY